MQPKKRNNNNRKNTRSIVRAIPRSVGPTPYKDVISTFQKFRFQSNASFSNTNFNAADLLDVLFLATSSTNGSRVLDSIRLVNIEMWGAMASTLVPVTVEIEYVFGGASAGGAGGGDASRSSTTIGSDHPAWVKLAPPEHSNAQFWQGSSASNNLFQLSGPLNTIIDITLEIRFNNTLATVSLQNPVLVSATAGALYVGGLDGIRKATTVFPPVGYFSA
jgi:hypothetical protein